MCIEAKIYRVDGDFSPRLLQAVVSGLGWNYIVTHRLYLLPWHLLQGIYKYL